MKLQDKRLENKAEVRKLASLAARVIEEKKLEDIVVLELRDDIGLADYFIIATASSSPQMKAGIDAVYKTFKDEHIHPYGNSENSMDSLWSLIDYGFLVVHIFTKEGREFYELDKLWHECERVDFHNDKLYKTNTKNKEKSSKEVNKENIKEKIQEKKKAYKSVKNKAFSKKENKSKDTSKKEIKKSTSKKSSVKKTIGKKTTAKKAVSKKSLAKKTVKKLSKKTSGSRK